MLFIDVRGSTALSEKLGTTAFTQLINRFYTHATKIIVEEDGLVEKLAGDEVAAFWGSGFAGEDYIQRTVKTAQSLLRNIAKQNIPVGIGVNAGTAYFGAMGSADRLTNISAIGDEVNMAARLASKAAAGEIWQCLIQGSKTGRGGNSFRPQTRCCLTRLPKNKGMEFFCCRKLRTCHFIQIKEHSWRHECH